MNRRNAVRNLLIGSGGLITLPFWMNSCREKGDSIHRSSFSDGEQNILAAITDTIIPAGNSIGALSVGVDKFLQKLIDDCYENPIKDKIKNQMNVLNESAKKEIGKSFAGCNQQQRELLLLKFSSSQNKDEKDFFDLMKSETIHGFNTSQKVMEEYFHYKVAPGHYYGCVNT